MCGSGGGGGEGGGRCHVISDGEGGERNVTHLFCPLFILLHKELFKVVADKNSKTFFLSTFQKKIIGFYLMSVVFQADNSHEVSY